MKTDKTQQMSEKRQQIGHFIRVLSEFLELFLAVLILVGIILRFADLPEKFSIMLSGTRENYTEFIDFIVDSVIAVELVHLLCQPNLDNVVEILLVAITREIIMLERNAVSTLLYVASLGILFLLRRFMFVDKLDRHDNDFSLKALQSHREHENRHREEAAGPAADHERIR